MIRPLQLTKPASFRNRRLELLISMCEWVDRVKRVCGRYSTIFYDAVKYQYNQQQHLNPQAFPLIFPVHFVIIHRVGLILCLSLGFLRLDRYCLASYRSLFVGDSFG